MTKTKNVMGKKIEIQNFKYQNSTGFVKSGFVNRTANDRHRNNKSDLGDNFVAPDGGWGWLVAIAAGLSVLFTYPVLQQFGILFRDKFSNLGITSSELTTIINVQQAAAMCSGFINGPLFRRCSHRQAALIGNFFVFSGLFLAAFANSFITYFISISLLYGTGRGIMFSTMTLAINTYFSAKRQEATAYQYAIGGVGTMILPYIVTFCVSYYGVSGAVLLLSALSLHNLACSAIFQPVKWHVKKVPQAIPLQDLQHNNDDDDSDNSDCDGKTKAFATCELKINKPLHHTFDGSQQNLTVMGMPIELPTTDVEKPLTEKEQLIQRLQNYIAPPCSPCPPRPPTPPPPKKTSSSSIFEQFVVIFDLDLLKDFGYINIVMGLTLINIISLNFHYLTPFILNEFGLNGNQIAAAMTVHAICDFVVKFLIALVVARIKCDSKIWLLMGCLATIVGRIVLVFNRNNIVVLVAFGWMGVCAAIMCVFWVLVLPSYVPLERLPAAIGLQRLIMGICNLIIGPFIGLIRDATNYSWIIHIMNALVVVVTISWLGEDLYKKWRLKMETKDQRSKLYYI